MRLQTEGNSGSAVFVNVHSLGKFAFCHRAGVLAQEQKEKDEDVEDAGTPRLNYLPQFEIELIREALDATKRHLWPTLIILSILLIVTWQAYSRGFLAISVLSAVIALLLFRKGLIHFEEWRELNRRIEQQDTARESHLGNPDAGPRQINWWGLLKNKDFQAAPAVNPLTDPELRLGGKPVRIANYRGSRIPVIVHHSELDEAKDYHVIRLAAYAMLLDRGIRRGEPVRWGIILHPKTMMGIAVPVTSGHKQQALETLDRFRKHLIEVENGTDPLPPPERYCHRCPYGRPRVFRRGLTETRIYGEAIKPQLIRGNDRQNYHCPCGDRFRWTPPHEDAEGKGLKKL